MFFCGDIALPFPKAIEIADIPEDLRKGFWVGNLEGTLLDSSASEKQSNGVFNNVEAIKDVLETLRFKAFVLANNHLLDAGDYAVSAQNLKQLAVQGVGAGSNLEEASQYVDITDADGIVYRILAFGWDCIECQSAEKDRQGVNPYKKKHIFDLVKSAQDTNVRLICFFHWNYELELFPQPYDRQMAHDLIDMGVFAVIGCHAHRTQQIEIYNGHPIVYGLGNFLFKQGSYKGGKLKFPVFCSKEIVFEISGDKMCLHTFYYDVPSDRLNYEKPEDIAVSEYRAEYEELDTKDYLTFFKTKRVQKKLLPIFKANEGKVSFDTKVLMVKLRGWLINQLSKLNLKSSDRSNR